MLVLLKRYGVKWLFTWAKINKFRKFRAGIAFIICANQFHTPKNGRESLELV